MFVQASQRSATEMPKAESCSSQLLLICMRPMSRLPSVFDVLIAEGSRLLSTAAIAFSNLADTPYLAAASLKQSAAAGVDISKAIRANMRMPVYPVLVANHGGW